MSSRIVQKPDKFPIPKGAAAQFGGFSLTTDPDRDKIEIESITEYADVVELVDSLDLGAVTSVKVFLPRCHCEPVRTLVWQSVL